MLTFLRYQLFHPLKKQVREMRYSAVDFIEDLLGRRDEMTPPRHLVGMIGGGDFKAIGQEFLPHFVKFGDLQPSDGVLEVGCGTGRMAVALTSYLNAQGRYEGLDVLPDAIDWCRQRITSKYQNFRFHVTDIYNKKYNPKGRYGASEYRFPYEDQSFDFVFLTSVFTHMLPRDLQHYLSEIHRVLKPDKRCLITFFLVNAESSKLMETKVSRRQFQFQLDGCRVKNKDIPEKEVAYEEAHVREFYEKFHLQLIEPIQYGSWCGRPNFLSYQDIVNARRTA